MFPFQRAIIDKFFIKYMHVDIKSNTISSLLFCINEEKERKLVVSVTFSKNLMIIQTRITPDSQDFTVRRRK